MNWKFWTWRKQIVVLKQRLEESHSLRDKLQETNWEVSRNASVLAVKLHLARRATARAREQGMTDEQMAEAFEALIDNKGFEAILQLITSEELGAVDRMTEDGASFAHMKKAAGAVDALTNLHHRLLELESQAKAMATRKPKAA